MYVKHVIMVTLLSVLASTFVLLADEPIDISYLPASVQATIKQWKGEGEVKKVKTRKLDGRVVYEVDYKERGDEKRILIGEDGFVIGDEEYIGGGKGKGNDKSKGKGKAKGRTREISDTTEKQETVPAPSEPGTTAPAKRAPEVQTPVKPPTTTTPQMPPKTVKQVKAEFNQHVARINRMDDNKRAAEAGLTAIAKETGVSVATLQAQRKGAQIGTAGLLLGNEMAKATGKPVSEIFELRTKREWDRIATDNHYDLAVVLPKLARVQQAMEVEQKSGRL